MAAFIHETDDGLPDTSLSNIIRLDELSILELLGQVSPFVVLCSLTLSISLLSITLNVAHQHSIGQDTSGNALYIQCVL
jgi:hypothetical protein